MSKELFRQIVLLLVIMAILWFGGNLLSDEYSDWRTQRQWIEVQTKVGLIEPSPSLRTTDPLEREADEALASLESAQSDLLNVLER